MARHGNTRHQVLVAMMATLAAYCPVVAAADEAAAPADAALQQQLQDAQHDNQQLTQQLQEAQAKAAALSGELKTINALWRRTAPSSPDATMRRGLAALYQELGTLYAQVKQYDQAIEAYERSLRADPDNALAHYRVGLLYEHARHNTKQALRHLHASLALHPEPELRREAQYLIDALEPPSVVDRLTQ